MGNQSHEKSALRAVQWRRISQVAFLLFFLYLMMRGHGEPAAPGGWQLRSAINPDVIFWANPLTWILTVISSRTLIEKPIWLFLGFVVLALLFGRVFCGWICPLGTLIDAAGRVLRPAKIERRLAHQASREGNSPRLPPLITHRTKYYLLLGLTVVALGGANVAGWFDPLAILTRGVSLAVYPAVHWWLALLGDSGEAWTLMAPVVRPVRVWIEHTFFPPTRHIYDQGVLHLAILLGVLLLSRLHRRWWCQFLCPLGAFYGLLARVAPFRRRVSVSQCTECNVCGNSCRMQAIKSGDGATSDPAECLRCMECADVCPRRSVEFGFTEKSEAGESRSEAAPLDLTRRGVLTALAAGLAAVPLVKMAASRRTSVAAVGTDIAQDEYLLRPPGARPEPQFLTMCIRCGECFRACPQNAIHPTLFEAGPEGLWTPRVVARLGYCEPSCTLCSHVCPTTALRPLLVSTKRNHVRIGVARVARNRCLAWNDREECGVCEEVCPVSPKAIEMRREGRRGQGAGNQQVPAPQVIAQRCIGCGICENKCPVEGEAAIRLVRRKESRHQVA
ncbi:MAG: 4Fe-4S binding protein [Candidatus Sumerlaeaceae bacterium]